MDKLRNDLTGNNPRGKRNKLKHGHKNQRFKKFMIKYHGASANSYVKDLIAQNDKKAIVIGDPSPFNQLKSSSGDV